MPFLDSHSGRGSGVWWHTIGRGRGRHVPAHRRVDGPVRPALELVAEVGVVVLGGDLGDDRLGVRAGQHVAREGDAAVPVAGEAVRRVALHRVGHLGALERPVDQALLAAALLERVDGRVAVAAEARLRVPDGRLGHVGRVEGPVPVAGGMFGSAIGTVGEWGKRI